MDVLGDAELGDPALLGDDAVALGVRGREVARGRRVLVVGAEVDVVVGQHPARRLYASPVARRGGLWLHGHVGTAQRLDTPAGPVSVTLPDAAVLQDAGAVAYWSPDPASGRFTVAPTPDAGADALLAAERERGAVEVELDERGERGGLPVRRVRYRIRLRRDREVVLEGGREQHRGGTEEEHRADVVVIGDGAATVRAGYSVRAGAPPELAAAFAAALDSLRIGSET